MGTVEGRAITEARVDLFRLRRIVAWVDISLHREQRALGRIVDRTEDGLAADDDDLLLSRDLSRGGNQVVEVLAPHGES
jgi:hypothetical protein